MAATGLHISVTAETLFNVGGVNITNSILTSLLASSILIAFALVVRLTLKSSGKPKGIQNFAEWIVENLHNLVYNITNDHRKTRHFFPIVATFFLFIIVNNWLGLVPGVGSIMVNVPEEPKIESTEQHSSIPVAQAVEAVNLEVSEADEADSHAQPASEENALNESSETPNESSPNEKPITEGEGEELEHSEKVPLFRAGTADLNTTIALALISVILTQIIGFHYQKFAYFSKFINFSSPIAFFVGILEMISEVAKIISFAFRLFGNIFAGEVLLAVISSLVAPIVPIPFYGLELFVGMIQALVFSMLSLVFFNMATLSHDDH